MKGINPIIPPGSAFDGPRRGRSNMRLAVVAVVAVHIALFAVILGGHVACKQETEGQNVESEMAQIVPPKTSTLPEPELLPEPVPSLPSGESENESQPILPPLETSTLPPVSEPDSLEEIAPPSQPLVQPNSGTEYLIASGDNFWTIGRKFGVSAQAIEQANPSVVPTRLQIGQKINIPTSVPTASSTPVTQPVVDSDSVYIVKSGDTLGHIAMRHKIKVDELKAMNSLTSDLIRIGQKLKLPEKTNEELSEGPLLLPSPVAPVPPIPSASTSAAPSLDPLGLPTGEADPVLPPPGN
tara:strand:- start:307 stop:1197 length:891 start_codon:yes stop_codon:yes gene_type:complete